MAPVPLTLYTRRDCHLCEEMKAEIARVLVDEPYDLEEVDIDTDPELVRAYDRSVPVLAIAGKVAFKGRLTAEELERKVARSAGGR